MAIAYFIPDQSKLLARSGLPQTHRSNTASNGAAQEQSSRDPGDSRSPQPSHPQQNCNDNSNTSANSNNNNFRANITIPLPPYNSAPHSVGCWDLITQVFCYALRFYHESRLNPSVIQISFEFSGGFSTTTNSTTTTTTPPTSSTTQSQAYPNSAAAQSGNSAAPKRTPATPKRN